MKIFDVEMSNSPLVKKMEEDFVLLKGMVHENLLCVYEFQSIRTINGSLVSRKQYFYTYEHWPEKERVSYLELGKSEINTVLVQLCKVVRYLHFRGILYKYINFDQIILIKKEGRLFLKLKDVAGNRINDYYFKSDYERFNHFLAPEILWGEEIDETVDIFSLGTVFFYIYYQIDYYFKNIKEVIHSDVANDIHRFIAKATSAIKEERYQSIGVFISELSRLIWTYVDQTDYVYYDKIHRNTKIAGREAIIGEVRRHIEEKYEKNEVYDGVMVRGDSGTGKTRVLREILQIAKFNRYDYVYIKYDRNEPFRFATVKHILRHIRIKGDVSPALVQKYGQELASLVPELAKEWNIKITDPIDPYQEKLRVLNRVYHFFKEYAAEHFTLLIIDEIGFVHPDEQIFFDMLLCGEEGLNYFVLMSGAELDQHSYAKHKNIKVIKLPSLTLEETGELVRSALGCKAIPYRLTHRLMIESQGKASHVERLLRELWQARYIYFDRDKMDWHLDAIDDQFSFEQVEKKDERFDVMLQGLKGQEIELLKRLSVLSSSFNMDLISQYGEIDEETCYFFLSEMENKKILNKRISDVEYVFVFYSNDLRKYFFNLLDHSERPQLYKKLTDYYERLFSEKNILQEAMIDYFLSYGNTEKAAEYCLRFGRYFAQQFNYAKSSDLMIRGLNLYQKIGKYSKALDLSIELVQQLIKSGRLELAVEKILSVSKHHTLENPKLIALEIQHAMVYYYKSDLEEATLKAKKCMAAAEKINHIEGYLKGLQVLCKCLIGQGKYSEQLTHAKEGLSISEKEDSPFFKGMFLNELGIHALYHAAFEEALEAFTKSLVCFQSIQSDEYIIRAYNNIGVVHFEGFGDYLMGREFFRKAHHLSQSINDLIALPTQLSNLGETYQAEERYEMAIRYYEQANQIAERVGDKTMSILALLNLCVSYIGDEHYSKAHTLIARLEHEFSLIKSRKNYLMDYYFLHFEYFITMNNFLELEQWRSKMPEVEVADSYKAFTLKVIDLRMGLLKSKHLGMPFEPDFKTIEDMALTIDKPLLVKHLRYYLLEVLVYLVSEKAFFAADQLLKIDDVLIHKYDAKAVRIKRAFIDACVSEYPQDRIQLILKDIESVSEEMLWKAYGVLSDLFFMDNNLYESLKYTLLALDVIFDLTLRVPQAHKDNYVLFDSSKIWVKNQLKMVIEKIIRPDIKPSALMMVEHIRSVEAFFDLADLERLYTHVNFENLMVNHFSPKALSKFQNARDLIKNLKKDEIRNLKTILSYLLQLTFSERGTVYLLDENDRVDEMIFVGEGEPTRDISKFINNVGSDMHGFFISKLNQKTSVKLLSEHQKGVLFLPIYENDERSANATQRREDLLVVKKKITGYVLLESESVIHRLNEAIFEQSKSFTNLIYVFIDNYNLKRVSAVDKLTGVYLRKYIEQQFAIQLNIARQANDKLSVIMLDIDKFKNVNDTYGHRKGDEILARLGELLKATFRNTDFVARYGGEEFIVLLPQTDAKTAYKVAEKIRLAVEDQKMLGEGKSLTISLGISTYPKDGANEDELIEKADQALYYSKNNGRNLSTSWDEQLIKEGQRYDKLTGILTGNISADTRNVQTMLDVMNQLRFPYAKEERILNAFGSLLDITEAEEIQFIQTNEEGVPISAYSKRKGNDTLGEDILLSDRLIQKFNQMAGSTFFIDWEEVASYDVKTALPDWKSYIYIQFAVPSGKAYLAIAVRIQDKEFDFSNYNFVETLKPVLQQIMFQA